MTVLSDLIGAADDLDPDAVEHLQRLLAEWQILADLSFADLLLFVRDHDERGVPGFRCVGQMRPYTAQTIYLDDLVGDWFAVLDRPMIARAFDEGRVVRDADPDWSTGVPVREEAIPVRFGDRVVGVISREANVSTARSPSPLELTYLQAAGVLAKMVADGTFPYSSGDRAEDHEISPRVGDGIMRLDAEGIISYASPNAISAYRRLGHMEPVIGAPIEDVDVEAEEIRLALEEQAPVSSELEHDGATVLRRVLPLVDDGEPAGALVLIRDVTELRRHQRALRVKDATIREIHHRVKNNLQTVASLLRLQTRRLASEEARLALTESVRRISSIALVHETLSRESGQRASFGEIASRIVDMLAESIVNPDLPVSIELRGTPGDLPADVATPLALVLTELLQNSIEHAFTERGGTVTVTFERHPTTLSVVVADDGVGLPPGESLDAISKLGLQIARTLITSELGGTLSTVASEKGTTVELVIPLP